MSKWRVAEGQRFAEFDVICEVATDNLTEAGYRMGPFAGTVTLLVEAQEEGYVHRLLVQEGQKVPVGRPIAVVCDHEAPADHHHVVATSNVYDDSQGRVRVLSWQSYLKDSGAGAGSGGGCM